MRQTPRPRCSASSFRWTRARSNGPASLPAAIRLAGERIVHVHAAENDRGTPGTGHIDWGGVAAALDDVGYGGQVVIESFTPAVQEIAKAVVDHDFLRASTIMVEPARHAASTRVKGTDATTKAM